MSKGVNISLEFKEYFSEVDDAVTRIELDLFFFVEFHAFLSVLGIYPDMTIGVDDPVPGDIFLALVPGFSEDGGDAL